MSFKNPKKVSMENPNTYNEFLTNTTRKNKGGRPKKINNKRNIKIVIYFNQNEYEILKEKFPNGFSDVLREFLLNAKVESVRGD